MKKLVIGILAHVDAGKTTLSESMLYLSGKIRKLGRVDNKDAYLDTYALEKSRGITIFSKQAEFVVEDTQITLLDTPGHVDFSAEMERTLQVLDYALLVINGADGVQGHTKTLWRLLKQYHIPVFIFINKMDQNGTDKEKLIKDLKKNLDDGCINFNEEGTERFYDELAMCDESLMEVYLETGSMDTAAISKVIQERKVFPCYFGSALKLSGIETFMSGMRKYSLLPSYPESFGAKVFKIARDENGMRLTYMKITGGTLSVKDPVPTEDGEEKVNQIRMYSGRKFEAVSEAVAGSICAVTGLTKTRPGQGLGIESDSSVPILEPVLSYQIILPEGCDPKVMLPKLREIEEEEPALHIVWNEVLQEIQVQMMGEVQIEILQSIINERFGVEVTFGSGSIVYKETIKNTVEGVGHFEPLRHYAEVHLLLEPAPVGSGVQFASLCSEDVLEKNWQRLVLAHLGEKPHKGVLTGAHLTDVKISLVSGRAHNKHTDGGDFREATFRAVRQGLKMAESVLLEPYYNFQLELPEKMVGRAMTDIEKMHGTCQITQTDGENAVLVGSAPVTTMRNYQKEVASYTKGEGRLFCSLKGYAPCHNSDEMIKSINYDSERDIENPTGSVFCAQGSGFLVSWDLVYDYMHIESYLQQEKKTSYVEDSLYTENITEEKVIGLDEIDSIINRTFYSNQGEKSVWKKRKTAHESYYGPVRTSSHTQVAKEEYLLVDGYNIIFAWPELKAIANENMDGARIKLLEILCNYQGIRRCHIIVVFDAYKVEGSRAEVQAYQNIYQVFTKEAQTADHYIEKFAHDHSHKYRVTVATSDGLEQIIIRGKGCGVLSANDLKKEVEDANRKVVDDYKDKQVIERHFMVDVLNDEVKDKLIKIVNEDTK